MKKNFKNIFGVDFYFARCLILLVFFSLSVLVLPAVSLAGEGDIDWQAAGSGSASILNAVNANSHGIFSVGQINLDQWYLQKWTPDGSSVWKKAETLWWTPDGGADYADGIAASDSDSENDGLYIVGYLDGALTCNGPKQNKLLWHVERRDFDGKIFQDWYYPKGDVSYCIPPAPLPNCTLYINPLTHLPSYSCIAKDVAVKTGSGPSKDGIYVVGQEGSNWRVERRNFNSDLTINWQNSTNISTGIDIATGIALDSDYAYVIGLTGSSTQLSFGKNLRVEKLNLANGQMVSGWPKIVSTTTLIYGMDVAVDDTGIYLAIAEDTAAKNGWRIEKWSKDGLLVWSQKRSGVNATGLNDGPHSLTVDSSGVYVAGQTSTNVWQVEKRRLDDGSIIWEKNTSGSAWGISSDSTGAYIAGTSSAGWRIEKRGLISCSMKITAPAAQPVNLDKDHKCQPLSISLTNNPGATTVNFAVSPAGKVKLYDNSVCSLPSGGADSSSCTITGDNSCTKYVSTSDYSTEDLSNSIQISTPSNLCGASQSEPVHIVKSLTCKLQCPKQITLKPGDQNTSAGITLDPSSDPGCSTTPQCTDSGPNSNHAISIDKDTCTISASQSLRYGYTQLQASTSDGAACSAPVDVYVQGKGWVETSR